MKFLCDEMLKRLGQWLRVAGHDVLILPDGTDDRVVIRTARDAGRFLLTLDRNMGAQTGATADIVVLDCGGLEGCVEALNGRLDIDWLFAPFTRCMACNTPLREPDRHQRERVPAEARRLATRVLYCPHCDQLFWDGSHVARMRERLVRWAGQARRKDTV